MSFWLKRGWLMYRPSSLPDGLNFVGWQGYEDPWNGGFRRITGFGEGWLTLLTVNYTAVRVTWAPGAFEDSVRLEAA